MIRTAIDSDDLTVFTYPADFILTYSDLVTDPAAFGAAHPSAQVVYIDRGLGDPGGKASIADVETGALSPADVPGWLDRKAAAGVQYLTVYMNRANRAAVDAAAGNRRPFRWVATLDGTLAIAGLTPLRAPSLVQFAGEQQTGIHADLSLVFNPGWHPSPVPQDPAVIAAAVAAVTGDLVAISVRASAALTTLHGIT